MLKAKIASRGRKKIFGIIVLGSLVLFAVNTFNSEEWLPIYYPEPDNLTTYSIGPIVDTLDECRDWVDSETKRRDQSIDEYDYECGLNCDLDNNYELLVCEKTVR